MQKFVDETGEEILCEPTYFFWARQDDVQVKFAPLTIYSGDADHLDIAAVRHKDRNIKLRISTQNQPISTGKVFPLKNYYIKVAIFADDMLPYHGWFLIHVNKESLQKSTLEKVKGPPAELKKVMAAAGSV